MGPLLNLSKMICEAEPVSGLASKNRNFIGGILILYYSVFFGYDSSAFSFIILLARVECNLEHRVLTQDEEWTRWGERAASVVRVLYSGSCTHSSLSTDGPVPRKRYRRAFIRVHYSGRPVDTCYCYCLDWADSGGEKRRYRASERNGRSATSGLSMAICLKSSF